MQLHNGKRAFQSQHKKTSHPNLIMVQSCDQAAAGSVSLPMALKPRRMCSKGFLLYPSKHYVKKKELLNREIWLHQHIYDLFWNAGLNSTVTCFGFLFPHVSHLTK